MEKHLWFLCISKSLHLLYISSRRNNRDIKKFSFVNFLSYGHLKHPLTVSAACVLLWLLEERTSSHPQRTRRRSSSCSFFWSCVWTCACVSWAGHRVLCSLIKPAFDSGLTGEGVTPVWSQGRWFEILSSSPPDDGRTRPGQDLIKATERFFLKGLRKKASAALCDSALKVKISFWDNTTKVSFIKIKSQ